MPAASLWAWPTPSRASASSFRPAKSRAKHCWYGTARRARTCLLAHWPHTCEVHACRHRAFAHLPLQLVLDRREDPLTPLLSPWTYQAMIHQLMPQGIVNNTLNMTG
ncbi:hypothetical protein EON68_01780, partial [archaeon]